jgi:hypothetical protein
MIHVGDAGPDGIERFKRADQRASRENFDAIT